MKKLAKNIQLLAAATALAAGGAALGEDDIRALAAMRDEPTNSLFNKGMSGRVPDQVADESASPVSFTEVASPRPKRYRKHDLVTISVRQDSEATTSANSQTNRKQTYDFALQQFLEFARFAGTGGIGNVANPGKLPEVKFNLDNQRSADGAAGRTDHMSLRITAEVLDVKPNGTIVLEAVAHIRNDREEQSMRLSGVARVEDIGSDNVIQSTQLANLNLAKETNGEVKEGTKRSWLNGFIDKVGP